MTRVYAGAVRARDWFSAAPQCREDKEFDDFEREDSHLLAEAAGPERLELKTGHADETERNLAGWTGLEPAASGVTGRRSNQLNYHPELGSESSKNFQN